MKQSKKPAVCEACQKTGPLRPQAAKEGWTCVRRFSEVSKWYCPEHKPEREPEPKRSRSLSLGLALAVLGSLPTTRRR